ncbi:SigE family RNA polymerase sigma factor [Nocardioides alcanivorans]|uniref:SigE family RNA polymerase sigma factor n=1 Tax=Nocardioides alcanivorans TaxID=2897352 RepID=UPI001F308D96|nr:SigE family RNA polymerase sigma factor [Nocardioides alcanivorans]
MSAPDDFTEFVAARYQALLRTARLLSRSEHEAEDLLQEALARCVPVWRRISADPEGYVRTVLVRQNISRWRRTRRLSVHPTEVPPERPVVDADVAEQQHLREALAQLAPRQRAVVVLRYVEDRPEREVATLLGCSVGTVKSQAHDGLARLRRILGEDAGLENRAAAPL